MALKIEWNGDDRLRVVWIGQRYSLAVRPDDLLNTVAHYYGLKGHDQATCPVCKDIEQRSERGNKRSARHSV